jgi:hypothetical protein
MNAHVILGSAAIAALIGFASTPVFADEGAEVATAAQHAGMAAGSADIKMVHMHLHHVVNCIVGPSGDGFDKGAGNPCDGKGNGALMDNPGDKKASIEDALAKAKAGIANDDVAASKKFAADAQAALVK